MKTGISPKARKQKTDVQCRPFLSTIGKGALDLASDTFFVLVTMWLLLVFFHFCFLMRDAL